MRNKNKEERKLTGFLHGIIILTVVMYSEIKTYTKTIKLYDLSITESECYNDISIKLLKLDSLIGT